MTKKSQGLPPSSPLPGSASSMTSIPISWSTTPPSITGPAPGSSSLSWPWAMAPLASAGWARAPIFFLHPSPPILCFIPYTAWKTYFNTFNTSMLNSSSSLHRQATVTGEKKASHFRSCLRSPAAVDSCIPLGHHNREAVPFSRLCLVLSGRQSHERHTVTRAINRTARDVTRLGCNHYQNRRRWWAATSFEAENRRTFTV